MILKSLNIGFGKKAEIPIVQGGMGYKVSTASLAAAVANCGGMGIISAVCLTENELRNEISQLRDYLQNQC